MKKPALLLPLLMALTPFVAMGTATSASAQEVCQNQFSSCVTACVKDRPPTMQDRCIEVCQTNNNACYGKHNGLMQSDAPDNTALMQRPDSDALAASDEPAAEPAPLPKPKKPAAKRKSEPKDRRASQR